MFLFYFGIPLLAFKRKMRRTFLYLPHAHLKSLLDYIDYIISLLYTHVEESR